MVAKDDFIDTYRRLLAGRRKAEYARLHAESTRRRACGWGRLSAAMMARLLKVCPVGEGALYECMVLDAISRILAGVVDAELARQQIPIDGGFCDIELPVCTEASHGHHLWYRWCQRYDIISLLVEVKNMRKAATHEDVNQLAGYLSGGKRGRCGILVSRNGFTDPAMEKTGALVRDSQTLILPLDHDEVRLLLGSSEENPQKVMTYLRRKENLLWRFNERSARVMKLDYLR